MIAERFFSWKDVAVLALGQSNPPQVGTSIASKPSFQKNHRGLGKPSVMQQVYSWLYDQDGRCIERNCKSRLDLQADHVDPRQDAIDDPAKVDKLSNLTLRCRRHNVIRRRSHKQGGKTHLTTESALMWILLVIRPRTFADFSRLCRLYGLTMADVRFREAWAMAVWLNREGSYDIEGVAQADYLVLHWPNGALTRQRLSDPPPPGEAEVVGTKPNTSDLVFLTRTERSGHVRLAIHRIPIGELPFSVYDLGDRHPTDIAVLARQPRADDEGNLIELPFLPPRGLELIDDILVVDSNQTVTAAWATKRGTSKRVEARGYTRKVVDDPTTEVSLKLA